MGVKANDITKDPLIQIKLEEIRIENELSQQQAEDKEAGREIKATARALECGAVSTEVGFLW